MASGIQHGRDGGVVLRDRSRRALPRRGSRAVESNRWMLDVCSEWWIPRSGYASMCGVTARRAEAIGIVTRQGQDPIGGLVAEGDRARAAVGGIAHNGMQTPLQRHRRNLAPPG